jgi:hypothetical protein
VVNWTVLVLVVVAVLLLTTFLLLCWRSSSLLLDELQGSGGDERPEHPARSPPEPTSGSSTPALTAQGDGPWASRRLRDVGSQEM